ncbi:hypothetical protein [Oceanitalea stevensii]|uniref:MrpA C-terminal/MbhD domain-containing protein n=1 Tax=Oceanitalea stevensii TaxID=2763072 RepID=A0ABR8Z482_9MICO|nr:hypothetical protein [Oceanitalea stevensii]MBD8063138.1 hypothetical protein [Oceanitalea stevensii]
MALLLTSAFAAVMVGILAVTRLFSTRVAAAPTALYGALAVTALLLLDVDEVPGGNIAGTLLVLTAFSAAHVVLSLRRERRRYAAGARQRQEIAG